jgi:hypothetical protein
MSKEIYEWLKSKNYQTEEGETGEYTMYFSVDMPKILEEYATILLKAQEEKHKEEMEKLKICTGCGRLSNEKLEECFLSCCPDNNYVTIREYWHHSKYLK